ncbi:P-type conjugative transfer protein TrbJ [Sphingomonas sp.]|uniref:P-type conjugative transfer protein TrbJ n=1 Tax=Sphingomonas sp. TaxID=28214 RepID=UPI0025CD4418|nr:P-type conjugative transfer protein TrbJ [Sphingomonas sp.]
MPIITLPIWKHAAAAVLSGGASAVLVASVAIPALPASGQIAVFDPTNYSQNLLTAARALQQIDNQIQSLQNQAQMLANQARNLSRVDFPELSQLTSTLQEIDQLMGKAQGIDFKVTGLDDQFARLFPQQFDAARSSDQQVQGARARLDAAMAAFRQTMAVQSKVAESVAADAGTLSSLAAKSQGAEGALQAQQATNQLLALVAKQQFQIQNLMAAQFRADATEAARRAEDSVEAQGRAKQFLGSGSAYTPQ